MIQTANSVAGGESHSGTENRQGFAPLVSSNLTASAIHSLYFTDLFFSVSNQTLPFDLSGYKVDDHDREETMESCIEVYPVKMNGVPLWKFRVSRDAGVIYGFSKHATRDEAVAAARSSPANAKLPVREIIPPRP